MTHKTYDELYASRKFLDGEWVFTGRSVGVIVSVSLRHNYQPELVQELMYLVHNLMSDTPITANYWESDLRLCPTKL